jgi:hypothetical protein
MSLQPWFAVPDDEGEVAKAFADELVTLGVTPEAGARGLRAVLLGEAPFPDGWLRSADGVALFERAADWLRATFTPAEGFRATAVLVGSIYDRLLDGGALSAADLAAFLQQFFTAIVHRAAMPSVGDPVFADALQFTADLFVDAVNRDEAVLAAVAARTDQIGAGALRPTALVLYLHDQVAVVAGAAG